jgi:dye decolorizing peroxidase
MSRSPFAALSVAEQEAVFGRRRAGGVPLSGGTVAEGPDLGAKTPDRRYLVPANAHVRRAHATAVGAGLMLRRSYSTGDPGPGLRFIGFQNDLRTLTASLTHMDASDALLQCTPTTAGATFLILPGFADCRRDQLTAPERTARHHRSSACLLRTSESDPLFAAVVTNTS